MIAFWFALGFLARKPAEAVPLIVVPGVWRAPVIAAVWPVTVKVGEWRTPVLPGRWSRRVVAGLWRDAG
jgi:hypothetical protein